MGREGGGPAVGGLDEGGVGSLAGAWLEADEGAGLEGGTGS